MRASLRPALAALLLSAAFAAAPAAPGCEAPSFSPAERLDDWGDAVLTAGFRRFGVSDLVFLERSAMQVVIAHRFKGGPVTSWRQVLPVAGVPVAAAIGDLNGDGDLDLVVAARSYSAGDLLRVFVAFGTLLGELHSFVDAGVSLRDGGSVDLAVEDVTGDGRSDVVLIAQRSPSALESDLVALPGDGAGGLGPAVRTPLADGATAFALGDFDADGVLDVALAGGDVFGVDVRSGAGDGTFGPAKRVPVLSPRTRRVRAFDLDADGKGDLVVVGEAPLPPLATTVLWNLSRGAGEIAFGEATRLETPGASVIGFDAGASDLTGDGAMDVVTAAGRLLAFPRNPGTRTFGPPVEVPPGTATSVAFGDMDDDGRTDVLSTDEAGGAWVAWNSCVTAPGEETLFVPVILDLQGDGSSTHTSSLTLAQRGDSGPVDVEMEYTATVGGGSGIGRWTLMAHESVSLSALGMLRSAGISLKEGIPHLGTLRLRFRGLARPSDAAAGASVRSWYAGWPATVVSMPAFRPSQLLRGPAVVAPLRRTALDRSNLALANAGSSADGPIVLRVTLSPAVPAGVAGERATREVTIPPGGFFQFNDVLTLLPRTSESAIARVERVAGEAPYVAWGVLHDRVSGDASIVPAIGAVQDFPSRRLTVPVAMESSAFESELLLANSSAEARSVRLTFAAAALTTPDGRVGFDVTLPPGAVVSIPRFIEELRARGVSGVPVRGPLVAGPVVLEPTGDGTIAGVVAGARTTRAGMGLRRVGVYGPAVPDGAEATTIARTRSLGADYGNVGIVNLGETAATFRVEETWARTFPQSSEVTLPPLGWGQVSGLRGSTTVDRLDGAGLFVCYRVEMLGAGPGVGEGDGAWVPMEVER